MYSTLNWILDYNELEIRMFPFAISTILCHIFAGGMQQPYNQQGTMQTPQQKAMQQRADNAFAGLGL